MKTALYCRAASTSEIAIEQQRNQLTRYVEARGIEDYEFYIDNGSSGLRFDRPGFLRMMADVEAGKMNRIVAADISRICRDSLGFYAWLTEIRKRGVTFQTLDDSEALGDWVEHLENLLRAVRK